MPITTGNNGKSAYRSAVSGGYTGSEASFNATLAAIHDGSPKAVYATLVALQTAYPTGESRINLVTADGNWYYWNDTAWTAGGVYQATSDHDEIVTARGGKTNLGARLNGIDNLVDVKLTNILSNYDFSNGATGWNTYRGTGSVANGIYTMVGDGTNLYPFMVQITTTPCVTDHIIFVRAKVKAKNTICKGMNIVIQGQVGGEVSFGDGLSEKTGQILVPLQDVEYSLFGNTKLTSGITGNLKMIIGNTYVNATAAINQSSEIRNLATIDLTARFGAGNEPSSVEMNKFINSISDVTNALSSAKVYNNVKTQLKNIATIDVTQYGAIGDGIANDTDAINLAILKLPLNGILFFPVGTYIVKNIALKSNMIVKGSGVGSIIKLMNGGYGNCLTVENISGVTIQDIQLDGNRLGNVTDQLSGDSRFNGILISNSNNIKIDNIWSHSNGYHGIIMHNVNDLKILNSRFNDNGFRSFHGGFHIYNCLFNNNKCYDNGKGFSGEPGPYWDGIFFFDDIKDVTIDGNDISSSNSIGCINVGGTVVGTNGSSNINIINNICASTVENVSGIVLIGSQLNLINVSGNIIHNCYCGIHDKHEGYTNLGENISITNNIIHDCVLGMSFGDGMNYSKIQNNTLYLNSGGGMVLLNVNNSIVSGNILRDNGTVEQTLHGIRLLNSKYNFINDNLIINTAKTTYQKYGVSEETTSDYNIIKNNVFRNLLTGCIKLGANTIVSGNEESVAL